MNKAILMGRLTADPELRTTQSNISVCSFTLAVDRRFKNQSGERETDFIPIVAWRQTAEFVARYFGKGARIALVGSIQPRSWDDDNGVRHYRTEVIADEVYFADSKRQSDDYGNQDNYSNNNRKSSTSRSEIPQGEGFMPDTDETSLPFDL
ncbi:MAG: single-stranded DNA-binding protein [Clostridiaceae bacterium]|nr:single-stranded DNA-binding protein [Clostridiaceae bacterium]